uniref:Variant surface glycoprotein n=1 Tax=Trypanosoma brucei TaxID=5691 RepID=A0A1V0FYD9_9TRYP|nr:variant surface glycoprotein [Trypanosoma brucei]
MLSSKLYATMAIKNALLASTLLITSLQVNAAQSKSPIANTAWKPLCDLSKDAQKLYNKALKLSKDVEGYFGAGQKAIMQAQILAAKDATAAATIAAVAITAEITDTLNNKKSRAEHCQQAATALAARAGYLHGRIAEFFELLAANRGSGNGYACLAKHDNGADTDTAGTVAFYQTHCNLHPIDPTAADATPEALTATGFPKLTVATGLTVAEQPAGASNSHCMFLSTTGSEKNSNTQNAEALPWAGGYFSANTDHSAQAAQAIHSLTDADKPQSAKTRVRPYVELWKAYKNYLSCNAEFGKLYEPPAAGTLAASSTVKTAIKKSVPKHKRSI